MILYIKQYTNVIMKKIHDLINEESSSIEGTLT